MIWIEKWEVKREPPGDFSGARILMLSGQVVINDTSLGIFFSSPITCIRRNIFVFWKNIFVFWRNIFVLNNCSETFFPIDIIRKTACCYARHLTEMLKNPGELSKNSTIMSAYCQVPRVIIPCFLQSLPAESRDIRVDCSDTTSSCPHLSWSLNSITSIVQRLWDNSSILYIDCKMLKLKIGRSLHNIWNHSTEFTWSWHLHQQLKQ